MRGIIAKGCIISVVRMCFQISIRRLKEKDRKAQRSSAPTQDTFSSNRCVPFPNSSSKIRRLIIKLFAAPSCLCDPIALNDKSIPRVCNIYLIVGQIVYIQATEKTENSDPGCETFSKSVECPNDSFLCIHFDVLLMMCNRSPSAYANGSNLCLINQYVQKRDMDVVRRWQLIHNSTPSF